MKTFLNVLYRRILYKIPLKLLLFLIVVFGILFVCFSNAESFDGAIGTWANIGGGQTATFSSTLGNFTCITTQNSSCNNFTLSLGNSSNTGNPYEKLLCVFDTLNQHTVVVNNNTETSCSFLFIRGFKEDFDTPMTSLQCQTEYNLIPIDSVDSAYCENNNLCPSVDCPIYSGDLTPGVSNIFINDIFHPGAFNIVMNIPQEIDWDYAYTNSGQNFNIDVVGYNVDYEKMQSVIDLQNYKPTDDDFSNIISVLAPYSKIIIFFVVLFSLWAMIKKPFKSKKL